ncbi:MAG: transposase [Acidobacteriota bacterium]|nr:transposase [Acidobacteriota bacterium]
MASASSTYQPRRPEQGALHQLVRDPPPLGRWHARQHGFDLHAGIVVPAGSRDRLERLCRYALRPPMGQDRLHLTPDGRAVLELRRRWTDGTTHWVFDPVELLERLAALTPRPRVNLVLYYGVLAPRAAWRNSIVPTVAAAQGAPGPTTSTDDHAPRRARPLNRTSADLMQRSFGFDVLACPRCPCRLKFVALIREATMIQRILRHLRRPADLPVMRPARRLIPAHPGRQHLEFGDGIASEPTRPVTRIARSPDTPPARPLTGSTHL